MKNVLIKDSNPNWCLRRASGIGIHTCTHFVDLFCFVFATNASKVHFICPLYMTCD